MARRTCANSCVVDEIDKIFLQKRIYFPFHPFLLSLVVQESFELYRFCYHFPHTIHFSNIYYFHAYYSTGKVINPLSTYIGRNAFRTFLTYSLFPNGIIIILIEIFHTALISHFLLKSSKFRNMYIIVGNYYPFIKV